MKWRMPEDTVAEKVTASELNGGDVLTGGRRVREARNFPVISRTVIVMDYRDEKCYKIKTLYVRSNRRYTRLKWIHES